jgi:hypothetical protein
MDQRFTPEHLETWRRDGGVVIQNFFSAEEVAAVQADFERVFERAAGAATPLVKTKPGIVGAFNQAQFTSNDIIPFDCSAALNLIGVHPDLIRFAQAALRTPDVRLYQCEAWAKFTGDADYDQPFHCDFVNHTLTVPAAAAEDEAVTILCYFTDVDEAHGPAHYVPRPDSLKVAGPEATLLDDKDQHRRLQAALAPLGRSTAAPAGSIFPYAIDVFHRGTNLTAPHGRRFAVMACFKAGGEDAIARYAWPFHNRKPWRLIFENATPDQLACFGVKRPGDRFWTKETLARAQVRYPGWDLRPYREALLA